MDSTNNQKDWKNNEKLVNLFRRTSRLMARTYHRRDYAHHGQAHHAQARVLTIIKENGSINQRDLLEMLDVRSSSLSEVLGKLERTGQIVRKKNEEDKRSFIISATEDAQISGEGPTEASREGAASPFACLDDQEREQLGSILEKLVQALKDKTPGRDFEGRGRRHGRGGRGQGAGHGRGRGSDFRERGDRSFKGSGEFSSESRGRHGLYSDDSVLSEPKHPHEEGVK
jgi:DNA-binding MarR family transcriptional regulator